MRARRKVRVGLLLDSVIVPAWTHRMLERIARSDYAELRLVVVNDRPQEGRKSFGTRLRDSGPMALYVLYRRFEDRVFRPQPNAFAMAIWMPNCVSQFLP